MQTSVSQAKAKNTLAPAIVGVALRGLHQMAQPLTVMQGSLELALTQAQTNPRQWIEFALEQAGRLASDLEHLQQLLRLQQPPTDACAVILSSAIEDAMQPLQSSFAEVPVEVILPQASGCGGVYASPGRLREAFTLIFSTLLSPLTAGSRIRVELEDLPSRLSVRFRVEDGCGKPVSVHNHRGLSGGLELSQACVSALRGELRSQQDPLWLEVTLPRRKSIQPLHTRSKKGDFVHV